MDERTKNFHEKELFDLRVEVGRWQDQRASFERNALTAVLAIWAFAAMYPHSGAFKFVNYFVWWVPVIACVFTLHRLKTFSRSINLTGEYSIELYKELADPKLKGWFVWLRSTTREKGDLAGHTQTASAMWYWLASLAVVVAVIANISQYLSN